MKNGVYLQFDFIFFNPLSERCTDRFDVMLFSEDKSGLTLVKTLPVRTTTSSAFREPHFRRPSNLHYPKTEIDGKTADYRDLFPETCKKSQPTLCFEFKSLSELKRLARYLCIVWQAEDERTQVIWVKIIPDLHNRRPIFKDFGVRENPRAKKIIRDPLRCTYTDIWDGTFSDYLHYDQDAAVRRLLVLGECEVNHQRDEISLCFSSDFGVGSKEDREKYLKFTESCLKPQLEDLNELELCAFKPTLFTFRKDEYLAHIGPDHKELCYD